MKDGDFVLIDYVGRVAETHEIFDLTKEDVARKEGIFNEKQSYKPALVVVGAHMVIPGVEKEIKKMKPGSESNFIVSPEDAFGRRDVRMIKVFPISKFLREKVNPKPGDYIEINGIQAKINSVSGGRVRVDFNHPLAGKKLEYNIKILKEINNTTEKVKLFLEKYKIEAEPEIKESKLFLTTHQKITKNEEKIIKDFIFRWIKEIKSIEFKTIKNVS